MNGYMLDTNICIYIMNNRPASVRQHFASHLTEVICISVITFQELTFGAKKSIRPEDMLSRISAFTESINVFQYDRSAAEHAASVDHVLQREGNRIGPYDTQIAGHALALNMVLVSNNMREFQRVPGLLLENWAA